jgi:hypothetical protein
MLSDKTMTYRIRRHGKKVSIFDVCYDIEKKLKKILPELERPVLLRALAKCRLYYEGNLYYGRRTTCEEEKKKRKKRELTEIERIIYQFLLKEDLNPSTTYRWFLATRVPSDIKEKLERHQIPVKQALMISANRK